MDLHQLEIFIIAAQYKNFTEASKVLNMVPSAVSHSVAMLESTLGVKLFNRNRNKLSLTTYGEEFLKDAYELTTLANNIMAKVKLSVERKTGKLMIGFVFPEFIIKFLPECASFYETHPQTDTYYMQYDSIRITRMLEHKELDIAFGRNDMFSATEDVIWHSLYRDPFKLVLHRDHPLAGLQTVSLQQIKNETLILMNRDANPGMFDMVNHMYMEEGIIPIILNRTNNHNMAVLQVAMKMGVMITTYQNICYMKMPGTVVSRDINSPLAWHEIGIAWNKTNRNPMIPEYLKEFHITV